MGISVRSVTARAAALAALAAGACAAAVLGSASAHAAEPVVDPGQGRVGVKLNHDETAAVAGGPIPALVTMVVPLNRIGAGLHSDTQIYKDDGGGVHASLRQVIGEAAAHPDGSIVVYANAPGTRDGRLIDIYQNWSN